MQKPKFQYSIEMVGGEWVCRPAYQLGTIGWTPYPWTACYGKTPGEALESFKRNHKHHEEKADAMQSVHLSHRASG